MYLGIDIGTSGVKAVRVDGTGAVAKAFDSLERVVKDGPPSYPGIRVFVALLPIASANVDSPAQEPGLRNIERL